MPTSPTKSEATAARGDAGAPPWLVPVLLAIVAAFVILSPWPLAAKLQSVGVAVSVNIPSHMLAVGHDLLPMSARNTGLYVGATLAVGFLLLTGRGRANRLPPRAPLLLLTGCIAALALDGINSVMETWGATHPAVHPWYHPSNDLRVITGTFGGFSIALIVASIANGLLWAGEPEAVADDMVDLGGYLLVCLLATMTLLRRPPVLYWPLAVLSILGVLVLATMVNTVPIVLGLRRQRRATTWRGALPVYVGALVFALCEVAVAGTIATHHG